MGLLSCLGSSLRLGAEIIVLILLVTFIPGLPPDVKVSDPYTITKVVLDGKLALNNKLDDVEILYKDQIHGPESFTDDKNYVYTSLHGGDVVKLSGKHVIPLTKFGKPCKGFYEEEICGRPLSVQFGKDGYLYVVDTYYGIFRVDVNSGDSQKIISIGQEIDGKLVKSPNALAVACNGDIYWSDSSLDFTMQDVVINSFVDSPGRLMYYEFKTKKSKVLLDNLHFPNGVILSLKEDFVLVAETNANRVLRYYLKGSKAGTHDIFADGLPGMPDNIQSDGNSGFLVSIVSEVHSKHPNGAQVFSQFPNVRKFFARCLALIELVFKTVDKVYPNEFCKKGVHYIGHSEPLTPLFGRTAVLHISDSGSVLDCLWSSNKTIGQFSDAHIVGDQLYLGSPYNKFVARIPLAKIGWEKLARKTDSLTWTKQKCSAFEPPKPTKTSTPKSTTTTTTAKPTTTTTTPKPTTTAAPRTTTTTQPITTQKATTTAPKTTTESPKPTVAGKSKETPKSPVKEQRPTDKKPPKPIENPKEKAIPKPQIKVEAPKIKVEPQVKVQSEAKNPKTKSPKNEL